MHHKQHAMARPLCLTPRLPLSPVLRGGEARQDPCGCRRGCALPMPGVGRCLVLCCCACILYASAAGCGLVQTVTPTHRPLPLHSCFLFGSCSPAGRGQLSFLNLYLFVMHAQKFHGLRIKNPLCCKLFFAIPLDKISCLRAMQECSSWYSWCFCYSMYGI